MSCRRCEGPSDLSLAWHWMNRGNRSNPDEPFGFWNYGITNTDIDLHVLLTA